MGGNNTVTTATLTNNYFYTAAPGSLPVFLFHRFFEFHRMVPFYGHRLAIACGLIALFRVQHSA